MKLKSPTGIALAAAVGSNVNNLRTSSWVRSCKQRWSERSCGRASVLSTSAAVPARARSRSPSVPALPGRCEALTFQRRLPARAAERLPPGAPVKFVRADATTVRIGRFQSPFFALWRHVFRGAGPRFCQFAHGGEPSGRRAFGT